MYTKVMSESIIFVNKDDQQVGTGTREQAWTTGLYVRVARAILKDENGRILSQRRSPNKKSYPNCWTDSVSGHVDEGETFEDAIQREMQEEIGFQTELKFIGKFPSEDVIGPYTIREIDAIFEGTISSQTKLYLQADEVSEVRWFEIDELKREIQHQPKDFTWAFRETIRHYY